MPEIHQDVADISSTSQLLRFALAGQLGQLRRQSRDLTQAKVALAARLGSNPRGAASAISHALRDGPSADQLQKLDDVIGALASDRHGTGGLSSLALRLSTEGHDKLNDSLIARVPPSWTGRILQNHPSSELEVLVQASALLSAFMAADRVDNGSAVASIRERYDAEMRFLVPRLVLISVAPPTPGNYDAQILLGNLASYAFDSMRDWLESAVRRSPMAFRVWPAITKLVKLRGDGAHADELRDWVYELLRDSAELRKRSLYAGRSLDLELALVVPPSWSPAGDDWVGDVLLARAWEKEATIRERGTAAMGLWQRALEHDRDLKDTADNLRKLIADFRDPQSRPDAAAGLRWVAATLEQVIDQRELVCNQWPDVDEPWYRHVHEAAATLARSGIPEHLRTGAQNLFLHMILQNAGVYRRHAIETAVTSGWSRPFATALGYLLKNEKDEAWLRIRAEFALGFLQRPNQWVEYERPPAPASTPTGTSALTASLTTSRRPGRTSPRCTPRFSRSGTASARRAPKNGPGAPGTGSGPSSPIWPVLTVSAH